LTDSRFCPAHQQEENRHYEKYQRDPGTKKRYGKEWKAIRDRYAALHPLCEECGKEGRLTPAQEVHHILPLSQGGAHEDGNLMSLCTVCHSRITAKEGGRWREK
jgi:5-methylcytosine-specific restriction protein A